MNFNFGATNASASKSIFGSPSTTTSTQGFSFGTPAAATAPAPAPGGGFSFGTTTKSTGGTTTSGFPFGTPAGGTAATTPAATTSNVNPAAAAITMPAAAASTAPALGFSFGASVVPSQNTGTLGKSTGFSLGGTAPTKPPGQGPGLGFTSSLSAPSTGLNIAGFGAAKPATTAAIAGLAAGLTPMKPAVTTAKAGGLNLGGLATSTPITKAGGLTLGGTQAAKTGSLSLGGAGAASVTLGGISKSTAPGLTISIGKTATSSATTTAIAAAATTATSVPAGPTMNYRELEEAINKWTIELEEQEKVFLQQATQVNAWDRLLVENGEKITVLHTDVEKVKTDQQRLEHELDYIVAQQRELEDMLAPLEETIKTQQGSIFTQHADVEREHTYQLAETIDSQLKRMVQDLKEVIEHLNTSNSVGEANDPIHQIAKILNAHMDSLQWIDHNTAMCQRKVDEISRQSEIVRRDQERNVQLAFD